jgi:hypothetical protein
LLASIDIVTEEEVVGFWRESTIFKESQQVVVLAMNVAFEDKKSIVSDQWADEWSLGADRDQRHTTNLNGSLQFQKNGLVDENLSCFRT